MDTVKETLFIGATHGDEGFSLDVLKNLELRYSKNIYQYDWIIGNPAALKENVRYIQADLNRSAPGNFVSSTYEERRALEIVELSKQYTFAVDLHGSVSECGVITIIPYPTLRNILLAAAFPIENNVIWYAKSSLKKGPLVQFAQCAGIEIECGPKSSSTIKTELENVLSSFLENGVHMSIDQLINSFEQKSFFNVFGELEENGQVYTDFMPVTTPGEKFYPFLSHQYPGIACYKMSKVRFEDLFLV